MPKTCSNQQRQRRFFLLLQSCKSLNHLYQIHAQLHLHGLSTKPSLLHKLISSSSTLHALPHAHLTFLHVSSPTPTTWNQIIRAFSRSPNPHHSLLLYKRMLRTPTRPNAYTYSSLFNACSDAVEGREVHARVVVDGFVGNAHVQTSLVGMYGRVGGRDGLRDARLVFEVMPERNVVTWNSMLAVGFRFGEVEFAVRLFEEMPERDVLSWTTMVSGCARVGRAKQALSLFRRMERVGVVVDRVTMICALSACADLGDLELGCRIHSWVMRGGLKDGRWRGGDCHLVSLNNALVNMYVKCGAVDEAYRVFEEMPCRSVVSWSTMIMGLVMHGHCQDALALFQRMLGSKEGGNKPDEVTFLGVLCACGQMGMPEEGLCYFRYMTDTCNINPTIEHFSCIAVMLSQAGRLDDALQLIEREMPMEANETVWSALLVGCRIHMNLPVASHCAQKLLEVSVPGGQLAQVSNFYAGLGKWDDFLGVRKRMVEMRTKKPGGLSWVLVHGVVHEFMSGDQTQQCDPAVYKMVKEIEQKAKLAGHVPHTWQLRLDVEEEEQEHFLHFHSEKLAMAFGLVSIVDSSIPIRIVTNLRLCSDCHSIAKFISGSFKREVIIRERNRFHHFNGGTCSCQRQMVNLIS